MRIAAVDIGTNTVLLLVAEIAGGRITPLLEAQRLPRIGRGVAASGTLSGGALAALTAILREYSAASLDAGAVSLTACATSPLRDASNSVWFIGETERETGVRIEVLTGREEALLTHAGAVSNRGPGPWAVVDIGGGSTEIIAPGGDGGVDAQSLQLGAVRLTERYFRHTPALPEEIRAARGEIDELLAAVPPAEGARLLGVAGTATTLAALDAGIPAFDAGIVDGYLLGAGRIAAWCETLAGLTPGEILGRCAAAAGREDILAAGALILDGVARRLRCDSVTVSVRGLRYGIALRAAGAL